ncbi:hypothetical protein CASFOL_003316 [Castilleja foliolosa]|uniref:Uncharacterized protein n=1 Tax=Castilleja foliolosa TaxID=1961234 RepID=A0ABD3EKJ4_9LAMI
MILNLESRTATSAGGSTAFGEGDGGDGDGQLRRS